MIVIPKLDDCGKMELLWGTNLSGPGNQGNAVKSKHHNGWTNQTNRYQEHPWVACSVGSGSHTVFPCGVQPSSGRTEWIPCAVTAYTDTRPWSVRLWGGNSARIFFPQRSQQTGGKKRTSYSPQGDFFKCSKMSYGRAHNSHMCGECKELSAERREYQILLLQEQLYSKYVCLLEEIDPS